MRICIISGARPQFIKLAPLIKACKEEGMELIHIHSGQHYDYEMSDKIFEDLQLSPPEFNLSVGSGRHGQQTGKMVKLMERKFLDLQPGTIVVAGDTNSTIAGALAAIKLKIPVIHLEAGLRSHNWQMPEEINRIMVDRISSLLITTTEEGVKNLLTEGIRRDIIIKEGDTMVDALLYGSERSKEVFADRTAPHPYLLLTYHRAENVDQATNLERLMELINRSPLPIIFPIHPRTRANLQKFDMWTQFQDMDNLVIKDPMGYLEFIWYQQHATGILTDSGGIQKEAFILGKPCITLRSTTEWVETIELGANRRMEITEVNQILETIDDMINSDFVVTKEHPYGDGEASKRIAWEIKNRMKNDNLSLGDNIQR